MALNRKGHTQILLGYKEFWQYRQALEDNEEIKGGDPEYPFNYIPSDNPIKSECVLSCSVPKDIPL